MLSRGGLSRAKRVGSESGIAPGQVQKKQAMSSPSNGQLTASMKMRRRAVEGFCRAQIEALFAAHDSSETMGVS